MSPKPLSPPVFIPAASKLCSGSQAGGGFFCFAAQLRFFSCREQQVCMGTADAGHPVCTRTVLAAERSLLPPSTWPKLHIPLCQPCPTPLSWEMGTGDRHCTMQCRQGGHGQVQGSAFASVPWPVVSQERPYPVPCWHLSSLADLPPHIRDVANARCSEETPQTHACNAAGVRPDCPQNKEISLQEHLGQAKGWERAGTQRALLVCFEPEMEMLSMGVLPVV